MAHNSQVISYISAENLHNSQFLSEHDRVRWQGHSFKGEECLFVDINTTTQKGTSNCMYLYKMKIDHYCHKLSFRYHNKQ